MQYLQGSSFHVQMGGSQEYRDRWEETFGSKKTDEAKPEEPRPNLKVWGNCRIGEHGQCQWPEVKAFAKRHGTENCLEPCACECHKTP